MEHEANSEGAEPSNASTDKGDGAWRDAWNRFGLRHFLSWMTGIAVAHGTSRMTEAMRMAYDRTGVVDWNYPYAAFVAWLDFRPTTDQFLDAILLGSILGLGLPAVLSKPKETEFWKHPARVVFALCLAFIAIRWSVELLSTGLFGPRLRAHAQVAWLGGLATGLTWSIYALVRSRVGILWRFGLAAIVIGTIGEFYFNGIEAMALQQSVVSTKTIMNNEKLHIVSSLTCAAVTTLFFLLACVVELTRGKCRDWRVWSLTAMIPFLLIVGTWRTVYELLRAYQYGNWPPI